MELDSTLSPLDDAWLARHRVDVGSLRSEAVVGVGHAKAEVESLVRRLGIGDAYLARIGADLPRGILFHGAPGTGKTLLARFLAHYLDPAIPLYEVSGDELSPERVRALFAGLDGSRAVLYLDEIDHVGRNRDDFRHDPASRQTLIALLAAIDGLRSGSGLLVVASSTDSPVELDPALVRGGRLGIWVAFTLPDQAERVSLLKHFASPREFDGDIDWNEVAVLTPGSSPADLRQILDEAVGVAILADHPLPTQADVLLTARRRGSVAPEPTVDHDQLHRIAIHEAGHVGMAVACLGADQIASVSLSGLGGQTQLVESIERHTTRGLDMATLIALGGLGAEEVALGGSSEGAAHDLVDATAIQLREAAFGVLPDFPHVSLVALADATSEDLRRRLGEIIAARLDEAVEDVRWSLHTQTPALLLFAERLTAAGTLLGDELEAALAEAGFDTALPDSEGPGTRWDRR